MFPTTEVERFTKVKIVGGNYAGMDGYIEADNRFKGPLNFRCLKVMVYEDEKQIGCFGFRDTDKLEIVPKTTSIKLMSDEDRAVRAKYPAIVLWGQTLQSHDFFITNECYQAQSDNAPWNVIYRETDGSWHTIDDLKNPEIKEKFDGLTQP